MAVFDFISGSDFRTSLEYDYNELISASKYSLWKSVHVLAGSIIEAILTDYLIAIDYKEKQGHDPLEMDLSNLIQSCFKEKILDEKAVGLCNVIRNYRNLIHPGRIIRLNEKIDQNSAKIALALVEMIVERISTNRRETYGFTAEQIIAKIQKDSSAISIITHILDTTKPHEKERLLLDVIPDRYMKIYHDYDYDPTLKNQILSNLGSCFRAAFDKSEDSAREKVAKKFVKILQHESEDIVFVYETVFFRCADLSYLNNEELTLVKTHILSSLGRDPSISLIRALGGIGTYLIDKELANFIDLLVRIIVKDIGKKIAVFAEQTLQSEYFNLNNDKYQKSYLRRLDQWIANYQEKADSQRVIESLLDIKKSFEIPF